MAAATKWLKLAFLYFSSSFSSCGALQSRHGVRGDGRRKVCQNTSNLTLIFVKLDFNGNLERTYIVDQRLSQHKEDHLVNSGTSHSPYSYSQRCSCLMQGNTLVKPAMAMWLPFLALQHGHSRLMLLVRYWDVLSSESGAKCY